MLPKPNRKLWLPYIKTYEDFNKKIPDELKELFKKVRKTIGEPKDSFEIQIDLNKLKFCDNILNIDVKFNPLRTGKTSYQEKDIIYYSNININDLLTNKNIIDIPIRIDDVNINIDKLVSVISHEIRHIYDLYIINEKSDMKSFIDSYNYGILKNLEKNDDFKNFLFLVYLSLEHELIARNTMIWEFFMDCHCSKKELYNLYENSSIYKSFINLESFEYNNLLKIPDILNKVKIFISYFKRNDCENMRDVELFFENWQKYFLNKSDEYKIEGHKVLDDLWELLNENLWIDRNKKTKNVKELLLYIHQNYIFKDK